MTELSWLLDLLLNHPLDDKTKKHVAKRISSVEKLLSGRPQSASLTQPTRTVDSRGITQSPSTLAAMARHEQGLASSGLPIPASAQIEVPPGVLVASPAAAQAIQSRNIAIESALSGKEEKGRTSPRKF